MIITKETYFVHMQFLRSYFRHENIRKSYDWKFKIFKNSQELSHAHNWFLYIIPIFVSLSLSLFLLLTMVAYFDLV